MIALSIDWGNVDPLAAVLWAIFFLLVLTITSKRRR